jgi:arylsulfatase A-like enzyme
MIDLFPTFCAAAGFAPDPKWHVDGVNLLDTFEGKSPSPDRTIFWQWNESGAKYLAAVHGNLKLIIDGDNRPELYDVVADPAERRDISASHIKLTLDLNKQIEAWLATTSDAAKASQARTAGHNKPHWFPGAPHDAKDE